jgi:DNA-binding protein HU-beta
MSTTKSELVANVAAELKCEKAVAEAAVNAVFNQVRTAVTATGRIALPGFGSFEKKQKKETKAKNMRTGEPITVPAHGVVSFKPASEFKAAVK